VALNGMLVFLVVRPVNQLAKVANEVSLGNLEVADYRPSGKDEIATLADAFSRMRKSLKHAIKMLEV
jgi:protein-histidine pros-kinase